MATVPVYAMTMERQSRFKPLDRGQFVVIDGDDKLTLPLDPTAAKPLSATLHNLAEDPGEQRDLAPRNAVRVAELKAMLAQRLAVAAQAQASHGTSAR